MYVCLQFVNSSRKMRRTSNMGQWIHVRVYIYRKCLSTFVLVRCNVNMALPSVLYTLNDYGGSESTEGSARCDEVS